MRFEINIAAIPAEYIYKFKINAIPFTIVTLIIFWCFRMYHSLWQYASIAELYKIVEACVVTEFAHICITAYMGWMLLLYFRCIFNSGNVRKQIYVPHDSYAVTGLQTYIGTD